MLQWGAVREGEEGGKAAFTGTIHSVRLRYLAEADRHTTEVGDAVVAEEGTKRDEVWESVRAANRPVNDVVTLQAHPFNLRRVFGRWVANKRVHGPGRKETGEV